MDAVRPVERESFMNSVIRAEDAAMLEREACVKAIEWHAMIYRSVDERFYVSTMCLTERIREGRHRLYINRSPAEGAD